MSVGLVLMLVGLVTGYAARGLLEGRLRLGLVASGLLAMFVGV